MTESEETFLGTFLEKYTEKYGLLKTMEDPIKSKETKVFQRLAERLSGSTPALESFNHWVENDFRDQVINQSFVAEDGTKIELINPQILKPRIRIKNEEEILYPQFCRDNNYTYSGRVTTECITTKTNGDQISTLIELGTIPIMVGSKLCNLYGKTKEELVDLGECISDPFGYFILKSERTAVILDKRRMMIPLCYFDNKLGKLVCEYTSIKKNKNFSKVLRLKTGKKWFTIKTNDSYQKQSNFSVQKYIPIFIFYKVLENLDPEEAMEKYISKFLPERGRRRCMMVLNSSIIKMKNIPDYVVYLCRKRRIKFSYDKREELINDFRDSMEANMFPNIEVEDKERSIQLKLMLFSYMIMKFVMTNLGFLNPDSRDSWVNKRFDTAGANIKILLGQVLNSLMLVCVRDIKRFSTTPDFSIFGNTLRSKAPSHVTRDFERSFNTPFWGTRLYVRGNKTNVTEQTQRATPLALWSMAGKTNSEISTKDKKMEVREVHPSQRDKHCVMETPEGEKISFVKNSCITTWYSLSRNENIPLEYISGMIGDKGRKVNGETCDTILMVNGKFVDYKQTPVVYCTPSAMQKLLYGKRRNEIPYDIEVYFDKFMNCLQVYTDSSRATSPYFVVNQETKELVIDEIDGWDLSFDDLLKSGAIEFLDSRESDYEDTLISYSVENFYKTRDEVSRMTGEKQKYYLKIKNFTHCNVDPCQLFSVATSAAPMSNRQMGARTTYQASMGKQALGVFSIVHDKKMYGKRDGFKRLYRGTRSLCETSSYFLPMLDLLPSGQTVMAGFLTEADNQEDSVVVAEDFINTGNLNYIKYIMVQYVQSGLGVGVREIFQRPPLRPTDSEEKYSKINEDGLPKLDVFVKEGDCIIGKVIKYRDGSIVNNSIMCGIGEEGYVDRVIKTREGDQGNYYIKIKLRKYRRYQAGDKLAIRYAQKGTIGRVEKRENMLRVSSGVNKGVSPDILFNPLGYPSRQTVGLLLEGLVSKAALYSGERVDVSAFKDIDIERPRRVLKEAGLDEYGYEDFEMPDGTPYMNRICMVPLYDQVLKHQVADKIQIRSSGVKSLSTHQPKGGRSQRGGQKIGEMEKDAFVAHGAAGVVTERLMKVSDEFKVVLCQNCGVIINNKTCTLCENSKPGVLTIPYVFKLLIHLMYGMGIDMRIRTKERVAIED